MSLAPLKKYKVKEDLHVRRQCLEKYSSLEYDRGSGLLPCKTSVPRNEGRAVRAIRAISRVWERRTARWELVVNPQA